MIFACESFGAACAQAAGPVIESPAPAAARHMKLRRVVSIMLVSFG
jgi:hypothetical protein